MDPPAPAPGADPFGPEALAVLNRCVSVVQAAAARTGGAVRAFFRDDKGFVALLTYGLVGASHADDPARAASAAVRVREAFAAEGLGPLSAGVATGRAFAGLVGDVESRCDYTVLGDSVNMAARLMAAAGGAVWVDRPTHDAIASAFVAEALPPLSVKGRGAPLEAYALLRRGPPRAGASGRSFESLSVNRRASQQSRKGSQTGSGSRRSSALGPDGGGSEAGASEAEEAGSEGPEKGHGCATSSPPPPARPPAPASSSWGEAGSGKTVLVSEALRLADLLGVPCIALSGDPLEATRAYHPLRLALRSLVGAEAPEPAPLLAESAEETPGSGAPALKSPAAWGEPAPCTDPVSPIPPPAPPDGLSLRRPSLFARRASIPACAPRSPARGPRRPRPRPGPKLVEERAPEAAAACEVSPARTSWHRLASPPRLAPLEGEGAGAGYGAHASAALARAGAFLRAVDPALASAQNARLLAALLAAPEPADLDAAELSPGPREGAGPAGAEGDRDADATLLFLAGLLGAVARALGAVLVLRDSPRTLRCALGPLEALEARGFVAHLTGAAVEGVPAWLASELAERSRGNPFLLQEMARHARPRPRPPPSHAAPAPAAQVALLKARRVIAVGVAGRLLVLDEAGAVLPEGQRREALPVPVSLERLVLSRLDRLPPDAALLLKLASALGARFELGTALAVLAPELGSPAIARSLAALEAHGLLLREGAGTPAGAPAASEFRFAQAAVCEILYSLLSEGDRRRLHWRAALDLEARPGALGLGPSSLAHHCERAGAPLAAVAYLDAAAAEAMAAGAYGEASSSPSAPSPSPAPGPATTPRRGAGARAAAARGALCREAPVLTGLVASLVKQGRGGGGGGGGGRRCASGALSLYTHVLAHRGETLAGMFYALRNALLSGEEPETAGYVDACAFMYTTLTILGMHAKADAFRARARELLRLPRLAHAAGYLLVHEVSIAILLGRLREGEETGARAALELEGAGDLRAAAELRLNAGFAASMRGRFAASDDFYLALARDARRTSNALRLHWALTAWADAALSEAARAFDDGAFVTDRVRRLCAAAHVRLLQGALAAAGEEALEAVAWVGRHRARPLVGPVYVFQMIGPSLFLLADTLAALLARPPPRRPRAPPPAGPSPPPSAASCAAAECWREAAASAGAMEAKYFQARALQLLAFCPAAAPAERAEAAQHFPALFRSMGAHPPPI
eukprot:tig00021293_g20005.t1